MDVWEIIRRSALSDGMAADEREAVLQLCSDRSAELAELRSAAEGRRQRTRQARCGTEYRQA